jgi:hypothetical protein
LYRFFILTSKESNTYWDFAIIPQEGQEKTSDNCYVFFIPKVYNNKNINMVFLTELKDAPGQPPIVNIPPVTIITECIETYFLLSQPGTNGVIVDPNNKWDLIAGTHIKNHWSNTIAAAYPNEWNTLMSYQTNKGIQAQWIWSIDNSWEYGISGDQLILGLSEFVINGTIIEDIIPFYFAADNAALVYVNGERVGYTVNAFANRTIPYNITNWSDVGFDGQAWQHIYNVNIKPYLKQGTNRIVVHAANSDDNNGVYNKENNPAGVIFGCKFSVNICE